MSILVAALSIISLGSAEPQVPQSPPIGFFVIAPEQQDNEFIPWKSEATLNDFLTDVRNVPGYKIQFVPGIYEIEQRITVRDNPDLTISGSPGVTLQFADGLDDCGNILSPIMDGSTTFEVDHPERLVPWKRYQLFAKNSRGDRLLEFVVHTVTDQTVKMAWPAHLMPHVKSIPAGSRIVEDVNFISVFMSPGLIIQNLTMDGRGQGNIRGHTTYCGVYAIGDYALHRRPITEGLTVRGCTFRGLSGRGVAFYGIKNALIQSCVFEDIRAQAIEIDHYSSGQIRGNHVDGAEVGVMINDAFDSLVEANTLRNCKEAVKFLRIHEDDWTNTNNTVRNNIIGPGCRAGVRFFGPGIRNNHILNNHYYGLGDDFRVMNADGNTILFSSGKRE